MNTSCKVFFIILAIGLITLSPLVYAQVDNIYVRPGVLTESREMRGLIKARRDDTEDDQTDEMFPGENIQGSLRGKAAEKETSIQKLSSSNSYVQTLNLYESWDTSTGAWVGVYRDSLIYDGNGNRIESVEQIWNDSVWRNASREIFAFDGNGNQAEYIYQ